MIAHSDLILNEDGSVYHLNLHPEDIAPLIITVGDPDRVAEVSKHFDQVLLKKQKREFITHTGLIGKKKVTVISTGMGPGNIEIALIELDALVNIDLDSRTIKKDHTTLQIVRVGTSGSLQENIPLDSFVISGYAIGLDNLMEFYPLKQDSFEENLCAALQKKLLAGSLRVFPYCVKASDRLLSVFLEDRPSHFHNGITVTAPGFYSPQGRTVRGEILTTGFTEVLSNFSFGEFKLTNFEMETATIYSMSRLLGHEAVSLSDIVANRITGTFSSRSKETIRELISFVIQRLEESSPQQ